MRNYGRRTAIVGCGGTGGYLAIPLTKYVEHLGNADKANHPGNQDCMIRFVDGDSFEQKNIERQVCSGDSVGVNKADWLASLCSVVSNGETRFDVVDSYLTKDNINSVLWDVDVVFVCVDNHATRKLIDDWVHLPKNTGRLLINCGNETYTGNVQVTCSNMLSLSEVHSEVDNPKDTNPGEDCINQADDTPQLSVVNNLAASIALMQYMRYVNNLLKKNEEIYFDCVDGGFMGHDRRKGN